jgi:hypothetical protein
VALVVGVAALLAALDASAQSPDIQAVWSFNGGEVGVQQQPDGSFTGTVVRETRLATCPHPVGEKIWIDVRAQPDGQYFGKHQWYRDSDCTQIPERGNTAYRVLSKPDGKRFLRVCFSQPETPDVQPSIAPDGSSTNVNRSCADSDLVSPLPPATPKLASIVTLPKQGARRCLSKRAFTIRLKEPKGDALDTASVYVDNRRVETRKRDRITAPINLRGLPKGRYTVKIVAKTVLGRTIQGSRKYRTCAKKRRGSAGGPL